MRSLLFVPADSERKLARAPQSGADALILDLEDSVVPANRPSARRQARDFLAATVANAAALREKKGQGLRFLLEPNGSPMIGQLRQRLLDAYPRARFSSWSAIPAAVDVSTRAM